MLEHYFKYRRVIARFRRGALGNEMDHIAADLSRAGYKRDSVKLYLARIVRIGLRRRPRRTNSIRMARCLRPICNTCETFAAYSQERVRGSF